MDKDPKNKLVVTIVLVIAVFGVLVYAYKYVDAMTDKTKSSYARLLAESVIVDEQIANVSKTNAALTEIADIRQVIPNILPPSKVQSDIVAQILADGQRHSISINNITFPASEGGDFNLSQTQPLRGVSGVNTLNMSISFVSDFEQMIAFIEDIERNQRISQVENISIAPSTTDSDESVPGGLSVIISLNLYVRS